MSYSARRFGRAREAQVLPALPSVNMERVFDLGTEGIPWPWPESVQVADEISRDLRMGGTPPRGQFDELVEALAEACSDREVGDWRGFDMLGPALEEGLLDNPAVSSMPGFAEGMLCGAWLLAKSLREEHRAVKTCMGVADAAVRFPDVLTAACGHETTSVRWLAYELGIEDEEACEAIAALVDGYLVDCGHPQDASSEVSVTHDGRLQGAIIRSLVADAVDAAIRAGKPLSECGDEPSASVFPELDSLVRAAGVLMRDRNDDISALVLATGGTEAEDAATEAPQAHPKVDAVAVPIID